MQRREFLKLAATAAAAASSSPLKAASAQIPLGVQLYIGGVVAHLQRFLEQR